MKDLESDGDNSIYLYVSDVSIWLRKNKKQSLEKIAEALLVRKLE
jgi:hypothetical protein